VGERWNQFKDLAGEYLRPVRDFISSLPWIALVGGIAVCATLVIFLSGINRPANHPEAWTWRWFSVWTEVVAKAVLLGFSTAIFTQLLGSMRMYRNAISDFFASDEWIDKRNDLDKLWKRISLRILLPGFNQDAHGADKIVEALNAAMTKLVKTNGDSPKFYAKEEQRRIFISWADRDKRMLKIHDHLSCDIVVYDENEDAHYEITVSQTDSSALREEDFKVESVKIDGVEIDTGKPIDGKDGKSRIVRVPLKRGKTHKLLRVTSTHQNIDGDPIYIAGAGRVTHGMRVIIKSMESDLRVNFAEIGVDNEFEPVVPGSPDGSMERVTASALLPEQGFVLAITEIAAPESGISAAGGDPAGPSSLVKA